LLRNQGNLDNDEQLCQLLPRMAVIMLAVVSFTCLLANKIPGATKRLNWNFSEHI
jgi:hypothetical protein